MSEKIALEWPIRLVDRSMNRDDDWNLLCRLYGPPGSPKPAVECPAPGAVYTLSASDAPDRIRYVGSTQLWGRRLSEHRFSGRSVKTRVSAWRDEVLARGGSIVFGIFMFGNDRRELYRVEHDLIALCQRYGMADLHRTVDPGRLGSLARSA